MTRIRPLFDRILIQRADEPTHTAGGLFLPETAKEKPAQGTVLAVGQGQVASDGTVTPMSVKVNDQVIFGKYTGTPIQIDGEDRLILREEDILGVLES